MASDFDLKLEVAICDRAVQAKKMGNLRGLGCGGMERRLGSWTLE